MCEFLASGHQPSMGTGMTTADIIGLVQNLETPMVTALCCLWFIRYIYDQNTTERDKFLQRDEAMSKLAQAVDMNTKAIEQNGRAVTEMVNLHRAKVIP